jgi:dihydroorotate dehydrogenase (NAD+) catalytic subunit
MAFGTSAESAPEITRAVRAATSKPIYIKLSPNVTDIASIALACQGAGADGISLINTLLGMRIDLKSRKPVLANGAGGFSGKAVFPVALRMVSEVVRTVKIPVIGMGGVASAEDVIEMMMAGASAVAVGTENLRNPFACKEIIEKLPEAMEKLGIDRLSDIVGCSL